MTNRVRDVMTANVISLRKHAQFKEILLVKTGYDGVESAAGFLMRRADKVKAAALTAAELMTRPAITIGPDASVADAARTMHAKHVKRLPVVTHDGRLVGVVSRSDLLGVYDRPDPEIRDEITTQIIGDQLLLDNRAFTVTVDGGLATVLGQVDSEPVGLSLLDAIRHVDGGVGITEKFSYPPLERRTHRV